jgi:protoporphyrinogen/coproporphyrinogen III oxidase
MPNYDVIIIGAGLTGLSTAYYAQKRGLNVCIVDSSDHIGGVIRTFYENGFLYEQGPNSGVIANPETAELFDELREQCPYITAGDAAKRRLVLKNGKWHALPHSLGSAIGTPLFTIGDKFRILGEPFRKPGRDEDETLAHLVTRRMGTSFLEYAVDPFILGIYAGDPDMLVPKYALPKLYDLEQKYGSFIRGSIVKKKTATARDKKASRQIFSFPQGMSQLTAALADKVGREHIYTGWSDIATLHLGSNGFAVSSPGRGEVLTAKQMVTTVPSHRLPSLLPFVPEHLLSDIDNLEYARVVQVSVGFSRWEGIDLNAFGGLIPHKENRAILGSLFMSTLFPDRAPRGGALMSVFMGGVRRPEIFGWDDAKISAHAERELMQLFRLREFSPSLFKIFRYQHAIPQYTATTKHRIRAIEAAQRQIPGLYIAGNAIQGIGTADRIKQGFKVSQQLENGIK